MASNMNAPKDTGPGASNKSPQQAQCTNFQPLDKSSSNTLKRNPKMELTKPDLTKLLAFMEGELQAKDVVIATLKSERVKRLLNGGRYQHVPFNDPYSALERDSFASAEPRCDEAEIQVIANHQMGTLDNLVLQQRRAQLRMSRILKDSEERHRKVIQELEEEKKKHEHDTAQGDDITYGLEKERTRLKQELELEKQGKKKLEKDIKKLSDVLEEERNRQKQIVIMLLQDRKKFANKYLEERKRSEDLAQILTEEKSRIDLMADGLEEESKKSLQMEAELEKQLAQFDIERQQHRALLAKEDKRYKDLLIELEKSRIEVDTLRKQLTEGHTSGSVVGLTRPPQPPAKPVLPTPQTATRTAQPSTGVPLTPAKVGSISPPPGMTGAGAGAGTPMTSSVAKVVQPTATVSSVPVCGPTTGIARSVSPGQGLRQQASALPASANAEFATTPQPKAAPVAAPVPARQVSLSASPGTKVFTSTQGGKLTFHVTSTSAAVDKKPGQLGSRGVPPPVPPNKPVVPPKKEAVALRRTELGGGDGTGVKFGITISKEKVGVAGVAAVEQGAELPQQVGGATESNGIVTPTHGDAEMEGLHQELADFQQLFISMAPGKRA